jgi:hypothetical protein
MKKVRKGQILLSVFLIVLIIGIVGTGLLHMSNTESIQIQRQIHYLQAINLAESGIERAIWKIMNNPNWTDGWTNQPLGNGYYTVSIEKLNSPNRYKIISTGKVGYWLASISKTLYLEVEIRNKKWPYAFDYTLFWGNPTNSDHELKLKLKGKGKKDENDEKEEIVGNVFAYGKVKVEEGFDIDGYVYATKGVTGKGNYQVGELPDPLPDRLNFDTSSYVQLINTALQKPKEDFKLDKGQTYYLNGGILYVNGNVEIKDDSKIYGPGKIVATGDIRIDDGEIYNIDLISNHNIDLKYVKYKAENGVIYSEDKIHIDLHHHRGGPHHPEYEINKALIYTPGKLEVHGHPEHPKKDEIRGVVRGVLWGGEVEIKNYAHIIGAVYGDKFRHDDIDLVDNAWIEYDPEVFESDPPEGVPVEDRPAVKRIHWSEDNS